MNDKAMQHNHHHLTGYVESAPDDINYTLILLAKHRVALITGSASGIGRAVAHALVRDGCTRLILADIDEAGLATVSKELQDLNHAVRTCSVVCDTSIEADVQRMVDEGVKTFASINYAVNNAGVSNKPRAPMHELDVSAFDRVQNINLRGIWMCGGQKSARC